MPTDSLWKLFEGISECVSEIDWDMIHNCMKLCNWTWIRCNGVPNVEELKKTAKKQLIKTVEESIKDEESCSISCGGIKTTCEIIEGKVSKLKVEFILDDWSYEI